jgi:hypothetical protein
MITSSTPSITVPEDAEHGADSTTVEYTDEDLKKIITRHVVATVEFPFDFDRLWTAFGYSTKGHAVRALKSGTEGIIF